MVAKRFLELPGCIGLRRLAFKLALGYLRHSADFWQSTRPTYENDVSKPGAHGCKIRGSKAVGSEHWCSARYLEKKEAQAQP